MRGDEYGTAVEQLAPPLNATAHLELTAKRFRWVLNASHPPQLAYQYSD